MNIGLVVSHPIAGAATRRRVDYDRPRPHNFYPAASIRLASQPSLSAKHSTALV